MSTATFALLVATAVGSALAATAPIVRLIARGSERTAMVAAAAVGAVALGSTSPAVSFTAALVGAAVIWAPLRRRWEDARRRRAVRSALPDFLDLLALGVSAGLTPASAWAASAVALPGGPFREDVDRARDALARGRPLSTIVGELSRHWNDDRAALALLVLAQSVERGFAVAGALQSAAAALRSELLADIERRSQTGALWLLAPLFLFLFPTLFLFLFGGLYLQFRGAPLF